MGNWMKLQYMACAIILRARFEFRNLTSSFNFVILFQLCHFARNGVVGFTKLANLCIGKIIEILF